MPGAFCGRASPPFWPKRLASPCAPASRANGRVNTASPWPNLADITGGGLTAFGVIIILSSLVADKIGCGALLWSAFALHVLSAAVTLAAGAAFASGGKPAALLCLSAGMFLFVMGNGLCEAAVNPLVASLFPNDKSHCLNLLHAGWPGGMILGALAVYFMSGAPASTPVAWQIQTSLLLLPVALYGFLLFGRPFPKSAPAEHSVKYTDRLRPLGLFGALLVCFLIALWLHDIFPAHGLPAAFAWGVAALPLLACAALTKFSPCGWLMLLLLVLIAMQGFVELGANSCVNHITTALLPVRNAGLLLLLSTSGLIFALRFCAGPIVRKISPLGLLFLSALLASVGLMLLGRAQSALLCLLAAALYALGTTFAWPTLLAVASGRFPNGGAITLGAMGGVGMLCAGLLGAPGIAFNQDTHATRKLMAEHPDVIKRYQGDAPNTFLNSRTTGLDAAKLRVLADNGADLAQRRPARPAHPQPHRLVGRRKNRRRRRPSDPHRRHVAWRSSGHAGHGDNPGSAGPPPPLPPAPFPFVRRQPAPPQKGERLARPSHFWLTFSFS